MSTSVLNSLETYSKPRNIDSNGLQQIFHLLPIIFRFLRKNLQSQQKLIDEYNDLSNSMTISVQNLHDHENELLSLKDKISEILEQYRRIIRCLEQEIERLQIILRNPRKFEVIQETQKIKLDRLIKENENIQLRINQQISAIETLRTKIESDLNELQKLKPIFERVTLEQKDADHHWLQIGLFT
jgi:methyl-accepting chemotaxis protein